MRIEIWSDVVCPFCYIGKRKLEMALEQTGIRAEIEWRSFELNPSAPSTYDMNLLDTMSQMYSVPRERALAILEHEEQEARRVGLDFQWRIARPGNTFNAHRLIHLAKHHGLAPKAKERFLRAYFSEGLSIGETEVLRNMAIEIGLPTDEVNGLLEGERFADEVRDDESNARHLGVRGVPFFLINRRGMVSGARDVPELIRVLREQEEAARAEGKAVATEEISGCDHDPMCENGICRIR